MTFTTAERELGSTIMAKLRDGIGDWETYHRGSPEAGWLLCNSLAYSLAGEEVQFLTGQVHSQETGEIEIAAYTANYLIYFKGIPGPKGHAYIVIPRKTLSRLEVHSAPAVIPPPSTGHYATGSYLVAYGDSLRFSLPLAPRGRYEVLDDFAPSLWGDLLS